MHKFYFAHQYTLEKLPTKSVDKSVDTFCKKPATGLNMATSTDCLLFDLKKFTLFLPSFNYVKPFAITHINQLVTGLYTLTLNIFSIRHKNDLEYFLTRKRQKSNSNYRP